MADPARVAAYREMLLALLPVGRAWNRQPGSVLARLLEAIAAELAAIEERSGILIAECDPRTTAELLTDWERALGLPDPCTGAQDNTAARRAAILGRLSDSGGQSRAWFIALAARLGYTVTITEFDAFTCGMTCGLPLNGQDWEYAWQVNAPQTTVTLFLAGAGVAGDPLASWGNDLLECVFERAKPAHTEVIFAYS